MDERTLVEQIKEDLKSGEVNVGMLSARKLSAHLGKTTSMFYHRWGSFEVFLYDVSQAGLEDLQAQMVQALAQYEEAPEALSGMCRAYIDFAFAYPVLYELMLSRRWDWDGLRKAGRVEASPGLVMWRAFVGRLGSWGSPQPDADLRLLFAGIHGAASLGISGKANIDAITQTDRELATETASRLVSLMVHSWQ